MLPLIQHRCYGFTPSCPLPLGPTLCISLSMPPIPCLPPTPLFLRFVLHIPNMNTCDTFLAHEHQLQDFFIICSQTFNITKVRSKPFKWFMSALCKSEVKHKKMWQHRRETVKPQPPGLYDSTQSTPLIIPIIHHSVWCCLVSSLLFSNTTHSFPSFTPLDLMGDMCSDGFEASSPSRTVCSLKSDTKTQTRKLAASQAKQHKFRSSL